MSNVRVEKNQRLGDSATTAHCDLSLRGWDLKPRLGVIPRLPMSPRPEMLDAGLFKQDFPSTS